MLYFDRRIHFVQTSCFKCQVLKKNWYTQVRISPMDKIRHLLLIDGEIIFISHSRKNEKVILLSVGKDVGK